MVHCFYDTILSMDWTLYIYIHTLFNFNFQLVHLSEIQQHVCTYKIIIMYLILM